MTPPSSQTGSPNEGSAAHRPLETIGFIGLGVMGEAMCRNVVTSASWSVVAFDLNDEPLTRIERDGARRAASAIDLAAASDVVITCLPGGTEVRALILGDGGLLQRLQAGQILIDMSTSEPSLMTEIAARAERLRVSFADAPIARTRQAAVDGTLTIMVGAEPAVFSAIRPVLATMGREIVHCGGPGAGQVVKIMNNMVLFQTVAALAEAVAIAESSGVDGKVLFETMTKGSGDSFALRHHGMKSLLPQTYPDKAFSVAYAAKDLSYAIDMAATHGVSAGGALHVKSLFDQAIDGGDGDRYFPVIRRAIDRAS
jgi:3-hydroxyisobutyrate dehydrogenase-like beta-hydroxyacid dehydrogenase